MMTTVGFVLMIACANVAGLLWPALRTPKELPSHCSRAGRLACRQLLTEGLVLSLLGGGLDFCSPIGHQFLRANMTFNDAISASPYA